MMSMEQLPINNNGGQGYGFTLYQKELDGVPKEITIHNISDRAQVHTNCSPAYNGAHINTVL